MYDAYMSDHDHDSESQYPRRTLGPGGDILATAAFETLAVHVGQDPDGTYGAVVPPIYPVSTYAQDRVGESRSRTTYGRGWNPTRAALEESVAALEHGSAAIAFSSGMAAIDATFRTLCRPGDHVIIPDDIYAGTYRLIHTVLAPWGLTYTPAPISSPDSIRAAIQPGVTRLIWCETPTNPMLQIADLAALASIAHDAGLLLVVDSTFASPYIQRPLVFGADVVVHSSTKYLGGHGDLIGGVVVTQEMKLDSAIRRHQNSTGAIPSPFDAWLILRGIKTLPVRMERHCDNAMRIATYLSGHPLVKKTYYPGLESHRDHELALKQMRRFGGIVSFTLHGGESVAARICNEVRLFTLAESLGLVQSLICQPLRMTHASAAGSAVAPPADLVRLSVGLEAPDDLMADLSRVLDAIK